MSRYIELDSTYRNRTRYPNQADFIVDIEQNGTAINGLQAKDPISDASVFNTFTSVFETVGSGATVTGTITAGNPQSLVLTPGGGQSFQTVSNFYSGATLLDTTINQSAIISSSKTTSAGLLEVKLDNPFGSAFAISDTFSITNPSTNTSVFIPSGESIGNYYLNIVLEDTTIGENRTIISYDRNTHIATLNTAFGGGWSSTDSYQMRYSMPQLTGALVGGTINSFTLPATAQDTDDFYNGYFISITSGPASGDIKLILDYDGATRTGNVLSFSGVPVPGNTFELLQFSRDSYHPLMYSGSIVSTQETICHKVELLALTLPNVLVQSGRGGYLSSYPFVWIELTNVTSPSGGNEKIFYSNSPFSKKALFRATIKDVNGIFISKFLKLTGDGIEQVIKFKPNDSLKFRVYLPNGELLQTQADTLSPNRPNPLLQISALFEINRYQ